MANGWESGGALNDRSTHRLVCANPPGPGAGGTGSGTGAGTVLAPNAFKPNAFCGCNPNVPPLTLGSPVTLGATDFSVEFWYKTLTAFFAGGTEFGRMINVTATGVNVRGIEIGARGDGQLQCVWDDGALRYTWGTLPYGWCHVVCNVNRVTAVMELFINGVSQDTVGGLNAEDMGASWFIPLESFPITNLPWPAAADPFPYSLQGPTAVHGSLLTAAQIQNSYRGKRVQNSATTLILWDWRDVAGHTGWETDLDRIALDNTRHVTQLGPAAPVGVLASVTVPDRSGNGNDCALWTAATYGTTENFAAPGPGDKAMSGFMADPFWRA